MKLVNAFQSLAKINKIDLGLKVNMDSSLENIYKSTVLESMTKNWSLKEMINFSLKNKENKKLMEPLISQRKKELEIVSDWLNSFNYNFSITYLDGLEKLDLESVGIMNIPKEISSLKNLKELDLSGNKLHELPETIGNLPKLKVLYLSDNKLTKLPESITSLKKLKTLWIDYNDFKEFPEQITKLTNLRHLLFYGTKITNVPESILNLTKLRNILPPINLNNDSKDILNKLKSKNLKITFH